MSETRTPYIRMDGTRRATVIAQDRSFCTSLYNRFVATKRPDDEWPAWRDKNRGKAKAGGIVPGMPLTVMNQRQHPSGHYDHEKAQIHLPGSRPPRVVKSRVMA